MFYKGSLSSLTLTILLLLLFFSLSSKFGIVNRVSVEEISGSSSSYLKFYPVKVDKRVELIMSVLQFTSLRDTMFLRWDYSYQQDMLDFFKPFSNHSAVVQCEKLIQHGFKAYLQLMIYLSDPPQLNIVKPIPRSLTDKAGGRNVLEDLIRKLKSFYTDSNFEKFWTEHREFYSRLEIRANSADGVLGKLQTTIETLERIFCSQPSCKYHIILAPALNGAYGWKIEGNGTLDLYQFYGPTRIVDDEPLYENLWYDYFVYYFMSPLIDEFESKYKNPEKLMEYLTGPAKEYASEHGWKKVIHYLTYRAATSVWFPAEWILEVDKEQGFVYIKLVHDLISQYDRDKDGCFREFYPKIVEFFNSITEEHTLIVHVVDERGEDVPNAVVEVNFPSERKIATKWTNKSGIAVFKNMLNLSYTIKTSKQGYENKTVKVKFTANPHIEEITLPTVPFSETYLQTGIIIAITMTIAVVLIVGYTYFVKKIKRKK